MKYFPFMLSLLLAVLVSCGDDQGTNNPQDVFTYDTLDIPMGSDKSLLRISEVLPNPESAPGDEAFRITYFGGDTLSLIGWKIKNLAGIEWDISGNLTIGPDETLLIDSDKGENALADDGDVVTLISPAGETIQSFPFGITGSNHWVAAPLSGYVIITYKNGKESKRELKY